MDTALQFLSAYGGFLFLALAVPMAVHFFAERTAPPSFHIYAEGMEGYRGIFSDPVLIFGPGPDNIQPMRAMFPNAIAAEMAHFPDGSRTLAVAYAHMDEAQKAAADWPKIFVVHNPRRQAGATEFTTEGGEQHALLLQQGCFLLAFYGPTRAHVALRRRSSGAIYETSVPSWRLAWLRDTRRVNIGFACWALLCSAVFVDLHHSLQGMGATGRPVRPDTVVERLRAINALDVPVTIVVSEDGSEVVATWRSGNSKWLDFMKIEAPPVAQRITVELDPIHSDARVRRYEAPIDWDDVQTEADARGRFWSAEWWPGRATSQARATIEDGRPVSAPGQTWTYSGDEIEALLRDVILAGGWTWSPQVTLLWPYWLNRPGRKLLEILKPD